MNIANGSNVPSGSGVDEIQSPQALLQLKQALKIVYEPGSSNEDRNAAGTFLEAAKNDKEAPFHGFKLAYDNSLEAVVRHFGLLLLEHAIRYYWSDYSPSESTTVRTWVLSLAESVNPSDPSYLRNKIAQLWVEIAKRSWANEWLDMDELLVKLWDNSTQKSNTAQRDLVLFILETLVEDVFNREDSVAGLRNAPLSKACLDIFTPQSVFDAFFHGREPSPVTKCGDQGWLARLVEMLNRCLEAGVSESSPVEACAIKTIEALKACMGWSIPKAVATANVVDGVGRALMVDSTAVKMVATECLHTLFAKPFFDDDDFQSLVCPMYRSQTVNLLKKIFEWTQVDVNSIDEDRYLFLKRFSEMMAVLGSFIEEKAHSKSLPSEVDLAGLMELFFTIASHESLAVSIPVLNLWTKLLRSDAVAQMDAAQPFVPRLLELSSARLFRYEAIEEGNLPSSVIFLNEDLDTIPERHAFLGNYRRFCQSIVESITKKRPFEAFPFIMGNADNTLTTVYGSTVPVDQYRKNSPAYLQVDAQFTVVESALKGYMKWVDGSSSAPDSNRETLERNLEAWCEQILNKDFQDPMIKRRVIQLMVTFSTTALESRVELMLKILEHILLTRPAEHAGTHSYAEAVKELTTICTTEIQRLAMKMPDHLMRVYDQLQNKINEIVVTENVDDRTKIAYHTFLFTINHRATTIDPQIRQQRLEGYMLPVLDSWRSPTLTESLETFQGFCHILGLDKVQEYLVSRRVHEIADFTQHSLDLEGQALQAELTEKFKNLPIRATKAFIAVSTEKLKRPSGAYNIACALWHDAIPLILPNLLKFLSHAHGFHNPQNWQGLPLELQPIVKKILTDRFWQAGISSGSRDDFYENVSKTKTTMEGLASSIRGAVRMVRESCYSILWCMSRLDVHFYGLEELPGPLALALYQDSHTLSSHQMSVLLNMTRYIIDDCPTTYRQHFLTPLLASLFAQVDTKVYGEWNDLIERGQGVSQAGDDQLAEEMREESILRQLTYTAVLIVAGLLDPQRPGDNNVANPGHLPQLVLPEMSASASVEQSMRDFILSSDVVLEPLILFCNHALRMRDSRCCGIIIRVFRSIVPEFRADRPDIREFICREVLMGAITSLHEDYFVDVQKELAQLIAGICLLYSPTSQTPRNLLLSLPGITETKVDTCFKKLATAQSTRQQRALFLELLDGLRGVPMSEKGKLPRASKQRAELENERRQRQQRQQQYAEERQKSPDLGGIAEMF